jgi:hypothetical protein
LLLQFSADWPGIVCALWLIGLWFAAPLIGEREHSKAARVRDAIFLGTILPFVLGFLHVLYPAACAASLIVLCLLRIGLRREPGVRSGEAWSGAIGYGAVAVTIAMSAWPAIVRPLLDGDSIGYHLPNAAAWSHAHSVWTTTTTYWWYPPGSELFASGLYTISGPFSLGLAGTAAIVLLGLRLVEWGSLYAPRWVAGLIAAATLSVPAIALQAGNMQNDVWLAAWLLEALWAHRDAGGGAKAKSLAILSLVKPMGILYAAGVQALSRAWPSRRAAVAYLPFVAWIVHDAILIPFAVISPAATHYWDLRQSTIAGNGFAGLIALLGALAKFGGPAFCMLLIAALFLTPRLDDKRLAWSALALTALYLILPFSYSNGVPQLVTDGTSLRYLIPVLAIGALALASVARRFAWPIAFVAVAVTILGVRSVSNIFWNDSTTHDAAFAGLAFFAWPLLPRRFQGAAGACLVVAAVTMANASAGSHPAGYYDDSLRAGGETTSVFSWLADAKPERLVVQDLRSGAIDVISPGTHVVEATGLDACREARELKALWLLGPDAPFGPERFEEKRVAARRCGSIAYEDRLTLIVRP